MSFESPNLTILSSSFSEFEPSNASTSSSRNGSTSFASDFGLAPNDCSLPSISENVIPKIEVKPEVKLPKLTRVNLTPAQPYFPQHFLGTSNYFPPNFLPRKRVSDVSLPEIIDLTRDDSPPKMVSPSIPHVTVKRSRSNSCLPPQPCVFPRFTKTKEFKSTGTVDVKIYYPTIQEMEDFTAYIQKIEADGAHINCGIAKIVPPPEWTPRPRKGKDYSDMDDILIQCPVKEKIENAEETGAYIKTNRIFKKEMSGKEFREKAMSTEFDTPQKPSTILELERHYWKSLLKGEPIYGADTPGTLYEDEVNSFNITKLGTILNLLDDLGKKIKGVNTPYLYFGMYKTTFPWHAEDMDLYSINYVHYGEPKFWYGIPPESADRFERLASQLFPEGATGCKGFLRHKVFMVSPNVLKKYGIPYGTMVQYPGEFVVTFPRGYHMGFNVGFNIAEATNFALDRWIDYGKNTVLCNCSSDQVEIDMREFVIKYRKEEYDEWLNFWYINRPFISTAEIKRGVTTFRLGQLFPHLEADERRSALILSYLSVKASERFDRISAMFSNRADFETEKRYNFTQCKLFPYCAVCQYLVPDLNMTGDEITFRRMQTSPRFMTDQIMTKNKAHDSEENRTSTPDELLRCQTCQVIVHRKCYTSFPTFDGNRHDYFTGDPNSWNCYRCAGRPRDLIEKTVCHMCRMRGGALLPSVSGKDCENEFAHVICAVAHRRTKVVCYRTTPVSCTLPTKKIYTDKKHPAKFDDEVNKAKIKFDDDYLAVPSSFVENSKILQCELCSYNIEGLHRCSLCLKDRYLRYFHVTCAKLYDIVFERRHYPELLVPICPVHNLESPSCYIDAKKIEINEAVIVKKYKNEECELFGGLHSTKLIQQWAVVDFLDGSTSEIELEDIISCECNEGLCDKVNHIYGSLMKIKKDDKEMVCYFRGMKKDVKYSVELDNPIMEDGQEVELIEVNSEDVVRKELTRKRGRKKKVAESES